jgi:hypothetical protein
MNSNTVLKRIMTLLSAETKEVSLTVASLVDGTVVESATFDVGEAIDVLSEDGTKTPAPDGEHELFLKDEEGNEVRIRVIVKDGVIVERMNVEEAAEEEEPKAEEEVEMAEDMLPESEDEKEVTINLELISKTVTEMSYRIEELEKKLADMQVEEEVKEEEVEAEEEEELPKLDGAPVMASKVNVPNKAAGKNKSRQSAFLSKLYN